MTQSNPLDQMYETLEKTVVATTSSAALRAQSAALRELSGMHRHQSRANLTQVRTARIMSAASENEPPNWLDVMENLEQGPGIPEQLLAPLTTQDNRRDAIPRLSRCDIRA